MVKNTAADLLKNIKGVIDEQIRKDNEAAEKAGEFWENRFKKQEELIERLQKKAEKPKQEGPKKEWWKTMTMDDLRKMIQEEIAKAIDEIPGVAPEIPKQKIKRKTKPKQEPVQETEPE